MDSDVATVRQDVGSVVEARLRRGRIRPFLIWPIPPPFSPCPVP